ncbi:MAG TPA: PilZ domain-containing protein [Caulobacteraceae bacterium]|nr:PilZ domain-containing protein [Caulobacteraceae bacterium]
MQRALASYDPESAEETILSIEFSEGSSGQAAAGPFSLTARDKRSAPRRRVLLSAVVVNREFDAIFPCQVRDVSDTGARLAIPDSFLVPAGFWLIAVSSGLAYEASLVWRRYPHAGVALGEPIELDEPPTRLAKRLRKVWVAHTR